MARRRRASEDSWTIWPNYFEARLSRAQGRRIPRQLALRNPKLGEIVAAVKALGLKPLADEKQAHPAFWTAPQGRVRVTFPGKRSSKEELLRRVAAKIKQRRKAD